MKIQILGTGCKKCEALAASAQSAAEKLGLDYELVKVTNIAEFARYGVMLTPALAIDGQVKLAGRVPSEAELTALLTSTLP